MHLQDADLLWALGMCSVVVEQAENVVAILTRRKTIKDCV
jgi:hypothetical protein